MAYSSLAVHIKTNMSFKIAPHMSWSVSEVEALTPFERESYLILTKQFLDRLTEERRKR
jgi:hypothetical protein